MHLKDGTLVLYDVTSSYLEGCCCALARFGYSRDGRRDKLQIVMGLRRRRLPGRGRGSRASSATRRRFGLRRVALVGDRGLITQARIAEELKPAGLDWLTGRRRSARWSRSNAAPSTSPSTSRPLCSQYALPISQPIQHLALFKG
jgi:hypothetical protein